MAHKFIINDGYLILGDVEFHEDLISKGRDKHKTVGGGRWHVDKERNVIFFYGKSVDFGKVKQKDFDEAFKQPSVERMGNFFSEKENFEEVLKEYEEFCNKSE
jgi:hypothetical protein